MTAPACRSIVTLSPPGSAGNRRNPVGLLWTGTCGEHPGRRPLWNQSTAGPPRPVPSGPGNTMCAHLPRRGSHPRTVARRAGARLRRLAGVLAAVTCGLLASAAIVPAAFAMVVPDPGGQYGAAPAAPVPAATVRVVTAGGMAGWQITLIALGAALIAAAAAVLFDRALSARRAASATTA